MRFKNTVSKLGDLIVSPNRSIPWVIRIFPGPGCRSKKRKLKAARKIMHDGAGLADISLELIVLTLMTLAFLTIGASMFFWKK